MSRPDARGRVYYDPEPDPRFPWYFNVDRADGAPIDYGSVASWRNAMGCVEQALTMRDMYDNAGPAWGGFESQLDLLAATVYNVRAQSPREMTPERWAEVKRRFPGSARQCLEQAELELEDM